MIKRSHITLVLILLLSVAQGFGQRKGRKAKKPGYEDERRLTELFFEASKQKMLGNFEEAADLYRDCLKIDPSNGATYYELANLLTMSQQVPEALPFAQKALELDPSNEWYALFTAEIHLGSGDVKSASEIYENLAEKHPSKVEYRYELASTYLRMNRLEAAIEAYDLIEEQIGVSEDISVQKEKIFLELDRLDDAVAELESLIANFPGEQRFLGMLAEVYMANDLLDEAYTVYERMLANDPKDPVLRLNLASYHRKKGDNEASFAELKLAFASRSLNIDNKIPIMMSYYGLTENDDRLLPQAYELLDLLTEAHPKDAKAYAMKADFLLRDGRMVESRNAFSKTVQLDSSRFMVWNQLINTSYELQDFDTMEKDSRVALELFPNQGVLYLLNGIANNSLKNYEQAAETLSSGELYGRSDTYLYVQLLSVLADVYNSMGRFSDSDKTFEKALEKDPSNALILNNYSYFLSLRTEQLDKAEEMSKRSNVLQPRQASYQDTYAWILFQQKRYEDALEWIEKALENGGVQSGVIVEHYGDILYKLGEPEDARKQWQLAKNLGDHSENLMDKIEGKKLP